MDAIGTNGLVLLLLMGVILKYYNGPMLTMQSVMHTLVLLPLDEVTWKCYNGPALKDVSGIQQLVLVLQKVVT
jgi:hypothetical protein